MKPPKVLHVGIPAMDELEFLPSTLNCIAEQDCPYPVKVYICVNQPESYWHLPDKQTICRNNQVLMNRVRDYKSLDIRIIDRSSVTLGWSQYRQGVGMARKTITDAVLETASDGDIFISMDSDVLFESTYFSSLADNLDTHPLYAGIAVPYLHQTPAKECLHRAILRYEIYLRNYNLNLLHIQSPYAFTALGSAIVCRVKALRAVGGFDRRTSGEDFYFLQKLCKHARILLYNPCKVFPSARVSQRTPFGTGKYITDQLQRISSSSYPLFHYRHFEAIADTYRQADSLFQKGMDTDFIRFLKTVFATEDLWTRLRQNYKTASAFTKAFHVKADALRIFQFVRSRQAVCSESDENCLADFFSAKYPEQYDYFFRQNCLSLADSDLKTLILLRNFLMNEEEKYQKRHSYGSN